MSKSGKKRPVLGAYSPTRLRAWREHAELTIEQLAEKAGTTGATISRLERGLQPYGQELFERIAKVFDRPAADIIDRDPGESETIESVMAGMSESTRAYGLAMLKALRDSDKSS